MSLNGSARFSASYTSGAGKLFANSRKPAASSRRMIAVHADQRRHPAIAALVRFERQNQRAALRRRLCNHVKDLPVARRVGRAEDRGRISDVDPDVRLLRTPNPQASISRRRARAASAGVDDEIRVQLRRGLAARMHADADDPVAVELRDPEAPFVEDPNVRQTTQMLSRPSIRSAVGLPATLRAGCQSGASRRRSEASACRAPC